MTLRLDWLDPTAPGWAAELDALWRDLGAPHNAQLLPSHFVQTAFVKLGGQVLPVRSAGALRGVALLFPAGLSAGRPTYTLRLNEVPGAASLNLPSDDPAHHQVIAGARALLRAHHAVPETTALPQLSPDIRFYHPRLARSYPPTHRQVGIFSVGSPGTDELDAIRAMHMQIWGSAPGAQYPDDLHSAEFGPATSLVARAAGRLVGFLLGFYRFGGLDGLRQTGLNAAISIESQVMGVDSGLRRAGLAAALKRIQASEALARGIDVIHWTADPLQFANATLNFHKLRAVAGEFY
ncbi:MAG: hypothetical protein HGA65_02945, partial [Oscillochloris sp.]|nr:hypothetical protein [Oscillochloris sp.]